MISAALWGKSWAQTKVTFVSDNMAVVHALSGHQAPKEAHLAHLSCCLFFLAVHYGFEHSIQHIPGKANVGADALSRGKQDNFLSLFPQAHPILVEVPATIVSLLFKPNLTWCLERDVSRYFAQGLATTTTSTYSTAKKKYLSFCTQFNINPLPVDQQSYACLWSSCLTQG